MDVGGAGDDAREKEQGKCDFPIKCGKGTGD